MDNLPTDALTTKSELDQIYQHILNINARVINCSDICEAIGNKAFGDVLEAIPDISDCPEPLGKINLIVQALNTIDNNLSIASSKIDRLSAL